MNNLLKTSLLCLLITVTTGTVNAQDEQERLKEILDGLSPQLLQPGTISTGGFEYGSSLSADGNTFAFVKAIRGFERSTLVYSVKENGQWSTPKVFPFSGRWHDTNPYFTGDRFYFTSRRPAEDTLLAGSNLWYVTIERNGYSEPKLVEEFNDQYSVIYPTIDNEETIRYSTVRPGAPGGLDIFISRKVNGEYEEPTPIEILNTPAHDADPEVSPDGNILLFTSTREGGQGHFDLQICIKQADGSWSEPMNMGAINSPQMDSDPIFSKDGNTLFFSSERLDRFQAYDEQVTDYDELLQKLNAPQNGLMNIYSVDVSELIDYVSRKN